MSGLNVFGSAPAGLTAFEESMGGGDDFRLAENIGKSLLVTVHGPKEVQTSYGLKTAISCDVVVLEGEGTAYTNVLIFNAAPVDQMRSLAGQKVVALVGSYETKQGGQAPRFEAPTAETLAAAEKYQAAQG